MLEGGTSAADAAAAAQVAASTSAAKNAQIAKDKTVDLLNALYALAGVGPIQIDILLNTIGSLPDGKNLLDRVAPIGPGGTPAMPPIGRMSPMDFKLKQQETQWETDRIAAQTARDNANAQEQKRLADQQAPRIQERRRQSCGAFEQAAKDTANHFKGKLDAIPGLLSPSAVTEADMEASTYGFYQQKPDEYIRQLGDVVALSTDNIKGNEKEYKGVIMEEAIAAAKAAGVNIPEPGAILAAAEAAKKGGYAPADLPSNPDDIVRRGQYAALRQSWDDRSFFAREANLGFLKGDAVEQQLWLAGQSEKGKQNIYAQYGMGNQSPLAPAEKAQFAEMVGVDSAGAYSAGAQAP